MADLNVANRTLFIGDNLPVLRGGRPQAVTGSQVQLP